MRRGSGLRLLQSGRPDKHPRRITEERTALRSDDLSPETKNGSGKRMPLFGQPVVRCPRKLRSTESPRVDLKLGLTARFPRPQ